MIHIQCIKLEQIIGIPIQYSFKSFSIKVAISLKFHWYLRTFSLKFQKAKSKIIGPVLYLLSKQEVISEQGGRIFSFIT